MEDSEESLSFEPKPSSSSKKIGLFHVKFPVKRPSLPSLRTPTFFQTSTSSNNPSDASQTPSLLDKDPFADLRSPSPLIPFSEHSNVPYNTSVALYASRSSTVLLPSQASLQHNTPKRPKSSGHGQVRPANTRPAISTRPSLPSLHTLAQMNIGIPRRVRI